MPTKRSKASDYRGAGLDLDWRPFDERSVDRLIDVTRWPATPLDRGAVTRESIARRLNASAIQWRFACDAARAPTDRMQDLELANLAKALRRACALVPLHHDPCPWTGKDGHDVRLPPRLAERLRPFVSIDLLSKYDRREFLGVPNADMLLATFAESLADFSNIVSAAKAGKGVDVAEDDQSTSPVLDISAPNPTLVRSLAEVYSALFERKVVFSRDLTTNKPSGPLLRFLGEALGVLDVTLSPETLVEYVQPILQTRFDSEVVFGTPDTA